MPRKSEARSRAGRPPRGRPPVAPDRVRPHRVVTFVTHAEMAKLARLCESEDKSLSAVTHEILSRSLRRRGPVREGAEKSK